MNAARVLRVCALRRSGHHAIINWIMSNAVGRVRFFNDCDPDNDPFLDTSGRTLMNVSDEFDADLVIYNYEDRDIAEVFAAPTATSCDVIARHSRRITNVLVLRDPFNNLASKYMWFTKGSQWVPSAADIARFPELWKLHAREFTGRSRIMPEPRCCVSFNDWFMREDYRTRLAEQLGLTRADRGLDRVAPWGPNTWGDSFDNMKFDGRAQSMPVLDRWHTYAADERYCSLLNDAELIALATEIFGHTSGTETLFA